LLLTDALLTRESPLARATLLADILLAHPLLAELLELRDGLTDSRERLLGLSQRLLHFGVVRVLLEFLYAPLDGLLDRLSDGFGERGFAQEQALLQVGHRREVVGPGRDTRAAALGCASLEPLTHRLQLVEVLDRLLYLLWD